MPNKLAVTGAKAVAIAMKQINPDVVAAYPITPQTPIVQYYADFVADGLVDTVMVPVESEHSAMSAVVGSAAAGARTMTATAANGLALMTEIVYIAASYRLPVVMPIVNRALSGPINIHCDHSDAMLVRDSGWLQLFCEDHQEAYDMTLIATKISEKDDVLLPTMVNLDGFITSHGVDIFEPLDDGIVKDFVGKWEPKYPLLNIEKPVTLGSLDLFDYYYEHHMQQEAAMKKAYELLPEVFEEFEKISGRKYDFLDLYKMEDAEYVMVVLNSTASTAKYVVDELRDKGIKAGLLKPWVFTPFPKKEIKEALNGKKAVVVLDRAMSFGKEAPLYSLVKSALYDAEQKPKMGSYIYGLGGRDVTTHQLHDAFEDAINDKLELNEQKYLGLRD
ncbi:pyruvate ferredoxin oxidoreductase [Oceanotoga sp. DSM 15011]|uniref:Pyruvate ferredoxin oxidoreductase alpha subunit n=1 Tax=Oceanotoga teriensis TaxID=515440 RepID=A0AA45C6A0_9BACT|nr:MULTISPECIES: pyruvate ferredoxin oxidoreductase [Oceanotoga]MDN5343115.1 pyruvate ferredoxin oxidoreductase alpha subunit [Oceanotoga sp.]MDO7977568.1 pyruvate ferredoxin oxidoreductase [Oceanotoga teriensis]PWJ91212.1 pyruvate ferredoxin oxidoreductase alpha subunit [Oceanotoga teriensis]UYO99687.1 pyruvate ferredoxin oxidoreductase [Oceanotoga sp. DSM 15011]